MVRRADIAVSLCCLVAFGCGSRPLNALGPPAIASDLDRPAALAALGMLMHAQGSACERVDWER
jgi:hypothetical protein